MSEVEKPSGGDGGQRLPYEKPAAAWEEEMEQRPALMALCAKVGGAGPSCDSSPGGS